MNHFVKIILRRECALVRKRGQSPSEHQMLKFRSYYPLRMVSMCHIVSESRDEVQHYRKTHFLCFNTFYTSSKWDEKQKKERIIIIPKTPDYIGEEGKKLKKKANRSRGPYEDLQISDEDVEVSPRRKPVTLRSARIRIREKGKKMIKDIKETKKKVREKIETVIEQENVYTIPNLLCVTRIGLSPYLGYLIVTEKFEYALAFMIIAGISDWVDGYIARNYKSQASKIGSFLDPMADKILVGTLFVSLTYVGQIPGFLTALILGKDALLIISGFIIRYLSLPPPRSISRYFDVTYPTAQLSPTFISKVNTGITLFLAATTLAAPSLGFVNHPYLSVLWYVTAASTVVAAGSYVISRETYRFLRQQEKGVKKKR